MHRPVFGRPFANPWHLSLTSTPDGVYAMANSKLYRTRVQRGKDGAVTLEWQLIDDQVPPPREQIKYHYEYQPLLHDSKRNRLVLLKGDKSRVDVFARPVGDEGQWQQLATTGTAAIGREAMYIPQHDTILWLGDKLHTLDCATNKLSQLPVEMPAGLYHHECAMVYDPKHDVCVALLPAKFSGPMQTFLFRYVLKEDRR